MMNEDIKRAIEKNLPLEIGKTLQDRLALIEILEGENARLKTKATTLEAENTRLSTSITKFKDIEAREAKLIKAEHELEIKRAVFDAEQKHVLMRLADMKELTKDVFRSPVYREFISKNDSVVMPGGYMSTQPSTETRDKTIE